MVDTSALVEDGVQVALSLVAFAIPVVGPIVAIIKEAVPLFMAVKPYIDEAIASGESAFAAAEKASPNLGGKIRAFAAQINPPGSALDQTLEKITYAGTNNDWIDNRWRTDAGSGS
jgi:hypothetical protein